jgi:hypothetical protein
VQQWRLKPVCRPELGVYLNRTEGNDRQFDPLLGQAVGLQFILECL